MADQNKKNQQEPDIHQLLKVRREKLAELQNAGKDPFQITKYNQTHHSLEVKKLYEEHEAEILAGRAPLNTEGMDEAQAREALNADYNERRAIMDAQPIHVSIAGRMMFKRVMGKASFCNIRDLQGTIQVYVAKDAIGEESYADFKKSDIGDIYGVEGFAFRTKTGEISIHAEKMTLLSKSLQILPEKYHGITDTDMRYRQRYVDLIMNEDVKKTFIKRSLILKEIRNFLSGRDFMEVETPTLVSNAGGAAARPFETHYNALNEDVKLRISLELYLKRLIVGGLERVFEIGRVYRNEGVDTRHNPEFTLMELYQAYTDYEGMMELTESMFRYLAEKVCGSTKISYNGIEIDFGKPFERLTMNDAIKKYAGIDFDAVETDEEAKQLAKEHHIEFENRHTKGDIINLFFEEYCEKELIQPTFIMDHPLSISPLTKKKPSDPNKVERFDVAMQKTRVLDRNQLVRMILAVQSARLGKCHQAGLAALGERVHAVCHCTGGLPVQHMRRIRIQLRHQLVQRFCQLVTLHRRLDAEQLQTVVKAVQMILKLEDFLVVDHRRIVNAVAEVKTAISDRRLHLVNAADFSVIVCNILHGNMPPLIKIPGQSNLSITVFDRVCK